MIQTEYTQLSHFPPVATSCSRYRSALFSQKGFIAPACGKS